MSTVKINDWTYYQIQVNGERSSTNVSFTSSLIDPVELFVRHIPYNMYEDNLIPLFETIGVVAQLRLMMKHSGRNRGFAYVIYAFHKDAYRAITYLNNILVSSWCRLDLCISKNSRRIWLGHLDGDMDIGRVVELILEKVDPVQILLRKRRRHAFFILLFANHRDAALSRKLLIQGLRDFGPTAQANWEKESY